MRVKGFIYFEGGIWDGRRNSIDWRCLFARVPELNYTKGGEIIQHLYAKTDRYKPGIGRIFTHLGDKERLQGDAWEVEVVILGDYVTVTPLCETLSRDNKESLSP